MKIFKRVYYSVMAVLLVLMLTLSIVDANAGSYKNDFGSVFYANVNKHIEKLSSEGRNDFSGASVKSREYIESCFDGGPVSFIEDDLDDTDGLFISSPVSDLKSPVGVIQSTFVSQETQNKIEAFDSDFVYVSKKVENIVIYIPGTDSVAGNPGDVLMMTAHYDSVQEGANSNAASVGAMIENIKSILNGANAYKNDLLFVFTDAKESGDLGAYAFFYQFKGFEDVVSRVKAGADFDSLGISGSLMMYRTNLDNSKIVSSYRAINNGTFISSAVTHAAKGFSAYSDSLVYGDIPSLGFANVGGTLSYNTSDDNFANLNSKLVKQIADMEFKVCDFFGNEDLSALLSDTKSVFFSYLDIMTVWYPVFASFIFCGVIVGLLVAIIILNRKKKAFSLLHALGGAGVQLLTMLASLAALFVCYFIIALIVSGFGVIPVRAIATLVYTNPGILISAFVLTGALMSAFYIILKKAFYVKAADVVRGNALLIALTAIICSLAIPAFSYMFAFLAILDLVVLLLYVIFKDKFKAKFGMDMERLFLYVWPVILCAPLIIPVIVVFATLSKAVLLPLIMLLFMLLAASVLPYANYLQPAFDKLAKKLPKRTVRYEEEVTERVEDKAKKGKFTEVTSVKVLKKQVDRVYKNRVGVIAVSSIAAVAIILFSVFGMNFNKNLSGQNSLTDYIFDGSVVYVWDKNDSGTTKTVQIKDENAFNYFSRYVVDFKWDNEYGAYTKPYNNYLIDESKVVMPTKNDTIYNFKVYDTTKSAVTLKMTGVKSVTSFIFNSLSKSEKVTLTNTLASDTFTFVLPYGWGDFTMTIEGSASAITFDYTEEIIGNMTSENIEDVKVLRQKFITNDALADYESYISSGIIIKYTSSI